MKKSPQPATFPLLFALLVSGIAIFGLTRCERPDPQVTIVASPIAGSFSAQSAAATLPATMNNTTAVSASDGQQSVPHPTPFPTYVGTPTPDPPHPVEAGSNEEFIVHTINSGETLGYIARLYGSSLEELLSANQLSETDVVYAGQEIRIPNQAPLVGPTFKIIPDSELVYGPAAKGFDVQGFAAPFNGHLLAYGEDVEGTFMSGPEIVQLVADRVSVNPRLLLAIVEYRTGWVTNTAATSVGDNTFPLGHGQPGLEGLYKQLAWAANKLNEGYYGRAEGGRLSFAIGDNTRINFAAEINHGTAGVQNYLAAHDGATYESWLQETGPEGLFATYQRLFGNPFAYTVAPLVPGGLTQPPLQLPWPSGEAWYFTGGPHGGWNSGSAWAALDFVPDGEQLGCVQSDAWVTAMADGTVTRSGHGAVVVDLDGDGFAGTGWTLTYMHVETRDRIAVGTYVQTGDRLGHPSCEGGFSNGTHVHIARTYNGRWIAADGEIPLVMSGWVSQGLGREYDGILVRGNVTKEACECREESNRITAD